MSAVSLMLVVGVWGCGSSGGSTGPTGGGHTPAVGMASSAFSPTPDTVAAGTTVTWTNNDGYGHTVTSAPGSPETYNSGVPSHATYQHTFMIPGTYNYYCTIHGTPTSGMRGTIVVQ